MRPPPQLTRLRTAQPIFLPSLLPLSCLPRKAACSLVISHGASPRTGAGWPALRAAALSPPAPCKCYPVLPSTALNAALSPPKCWGAAAGPCVPRDGASLLLGNAGCAKPSTPSLLPLTNSTTRPKRTDHWRYICMSIQIKPKQNPKSNNKNVSLNKSKIGTFTNTSGSGLDQVNVKYKKNKPKQKKPTKKPPTPPQDYKKIRIYTFKELITV